MCSQSPSFCREPSTAYPAHQESADSREPGGVGTHPGIDSCQREIPSGDDSTTGRSYPLRFLMIPGGECPEVHLRRDSTPAGKQATLTRSSWLPPKSRSTKCTCDAVLKTHHNRSPHFPLSMRLASSIFMCPKYTG